jgi:hypothetical protein
MQIPAYRPLVAFAWAYVVGIYVHENIKQIKIKNTGTELKACLNMDLQIIAPALLNPFAIFDFSNVK